MHGAAMCDEDDAERSQQRRLKTYADSQAICFGLLPPLLQGLLNLRSALGDALPYESINMDMNNQRTKNVVVCEPRTF